LSHGFRGISPSWWGGHGGWKENVNTGRDQGKIQPQGHTPVTYFLQVGPISYFFHHLPITSNAVVLWIHHRVNPLIKSEPSGANNFPKAHQLATNS
jgi:hypothetical protein